MATPQSFMISGSRHPLAPPYNSFKNPYYLQANSISSVYYTLNAMGHAVPNVRWTDPSTQPENNLFTTLPNNPLPHGTNASEISRNQEKKSIFNHFQNSVMKTSTLNASLQQQGKNGMPYKTFNSESDRIKYVQATHAIRYGYSPSTLFFY